MVLGDLAVRAAGGAPLLDVSMAGGGMRVASRLTVRGESWLQGRATLQGSAAVNGRTRLNDSLVVRSDLTLLGDAHVLSAEPGC